VNPDTAPARSDEKNPPTKPIRRGPPLPLRILAVVVIVFAVIALAHFLRGGSPAAGPDADAPNAWPPPPPAAARTHAHAHPDAPRDPAERMRRMMAGILMVAAGDDEEDDPLDRSPEERRAFLADHFRLPFDYPRGEAPPDLLPEGAEVLMVFDHPGREGTRIVLVRFRQTLGEALAAFRNQYVAAGWQDSPPEAGRDDCGWLVRFRRERADRLVFARPRADEQETLAAVYEARY